MIVRLEEDLTQIDIEVLIIYDRMSQTVKRLESIIRSVDKRIYITRKYVSLIRKKLQGEKI